MKSRLPSNLEKLRVWHPMYPQPPKGSIEGCFEIPCGNARLFVISGSGLGWDHVSVSLPNRTPAWDEMAFVKRLFWDPEELVLQFHPPDSQHVNIHPHCLHLWKPWGQKIELPPKEFLG